MMHGFLRDLTGVAGRGSGADTDSKLASPLRPAACAALALASALLMGASLSTIAAAQELNRIWAGCVLSPEAVAALEASVGAPGSGINSPEVAFVVVYSLNHDNDGQPLQTGGATGPVICRNDAVAGTLAGTSQTDNVGPVTILDAEEAFVLRVQSGSSIAKRVCHTVNNNTDCFRISP